MEKIKDNEYIKIYIPDSLEKNIRTLFLIKYSEYSLIRDYRPFIK